MSFPGNCDPVEALASMMPNAWPLFFRQRKLLPIQLAAMPMIVRGESVLLCGPTASGKTEAAVAPFFSGITRFVGIAFQSFTSHLQRLC